MPESLKKNTIYNVGARGTEFVVSIFIAFTVARYLGKSGFGLYSLILAVVSAIAPLVDMGLSPILIREIVNKRKQTGLIFGLGIKLRIFACLLAFLVVLIWIFGGGIQWLVGAEITLKENSLITTALIICSLSLFLFRGALARTSQDLFLATESLRYDFISTLVSQIIKIILIFVVIRIPTFNIPGIYAAFLVSDIVYIATALSFIKLKGYTENESGVSNQSDDQSITWYLRQALPIGIATLLYSLGLQVDKFFLQWFRDAAAVGLFSAIYRIITVIFIFIHPVINVLLPKMTRESSESETNTVPVFKDLVSLLSLGLCLLCLFLVGGAPFIIMGFGQEFSDGVDDFRWLVIDLVFVSLSFFFLLAITTRGKQKWVIVSGAIALISKCVLEYFLIDQYGVRGAVTGTLIADFIGLGILYAAFCKVFGFLNPARFGLPFIVAVAVFMTVNYFLSSMVSGLDQITWNSLWSIAAVVVLFLAHSDWRKTILKFLQF